MSGRAPRRKGAKVAKTKQVTKPYEPKPEERAAIAAYLKFASQFAEGEIVS